MWACLSSGTNHGRARSQWWWEYSFCIHPAVGIEQAHHVVHGVLLISSSCYTEVGVVARVCELQQCSSCVVL